MNDIEITDEEKSFLAFIGAGIHVYPNDEVNLYMFCLDLEKRGFLYRVLIEENHIVFRAKAWKIV